MSHRFSNPEWQARDARVIGGPRLVRDKSNDLIITIVERWAHGVTGARAPACLVFSTDLGFTRMWEYPANWNDLSDAELVELSRRPPLRRSRSA